jgi:hypothetical protein
MKFLPDLKKSVPHTGNHHDGVGDTNNDIEQVADQKGGGTRNVVP